MGSLTGKPKMQDNSAAIAAQQKALDEQRKENERIQSETAAKEAKEKATQEDLAKRRRLGRRSLLGTTGDELGVS